MEQDKTCKTCKHFEAKALHDSIALCHHEHLEQDTGPMSYISFQPPTFDGYTFGCTLWEADSDTDASTP